MKAALWNLSFTFRPPRRETLQLLKVIDFDFRMIPDKDDGPSVVGSPKWILARDHQPSPGYQQAAPLLRPSRGPFSNAGPPLQGRGTHKNCRPQSSEDVLLGADPNFHLAIPWDSSKTTFQESNCIRCTKCTFCTATSIQKAIERKNVSKKLKKERKCKAMKREGRTKQMAKKTTSFSMLFSSNNDCKKGVIKLIKPRKKKLCSVSVTKLTGKTIFSIRSIIIQISFSIAQKLFRRVSTCSLIRPKASFSWSWTQGRKKTSCTYHAFIQSR